MNAYLTVYVSPDKINTVRNKIASQIGADIVIISEKMPYLSWVGETKINIANQKEAFTLERELLKIPELEDAEIIVDDQAFEDEINYRIYQSNNFLNEGKKSYPNPFWFKQNIFFNEALEYATKAFKMGQGNFDIEKSKIGIAIIDTGYSLHPETINIRMDKGRNFLINENYYDALDTLESTRPLPIMWGGHGTSCAALIIGSNSTIPPEFRIPRRNAYYEDLVNGLLPSNVDLIPFRVSRNIISFTNRMASAINKIAEEDEIKIISMSHASLLNRKIYHAATKDAYSKGIILVAAPGSHIFASKNIFTYPAKYPETIAPAASKENNEPWELTHGGEEVDLCAPGYEIYIPWPFKDKTGAIGYAYKWSEGSSFAVPIVATAAALWRMHHGNRLEAYSSEEQVELFRYILKKTATPFPSGNKYNNYGAGIINFEKLLMYPLNKASFIVTIKKDIKNEVDKFFKTDKNTVSFIRELSHLKRKQFLYNQSKSINEIDFISEEGTPAFKQWLSNELKFKSNKIKHIDSLLKSNL
jgi:hypothetical protein